MSGLRTWSALALASLLQEGFSMQVVADEATGIASRVVTDWRANPRAADMRPAMVVVDENGEPMKLATGGEARYVLPVGAVLSQEDGEHIAPGDALSRIPTEGAKTRDITGGLPRVAELFEARRPKDHAIIADVDGNQISDIRPRTVDSDHTTERHFGSIDTNERLAARKKSPVHHADGRIVQCHGLPDVRGSD